MLRDFVYIEDVAATLVMAATGAPLRLPVDIGTGLATLIGDVARLLAAHCGAPLPSVTGQYRFGDVRHAACDITATRRALPDWRPHTELPRGLPLLIAWVERQSELCVA